MDRRKFLSAQRPPLPLPTTLTNNTPASKQGASLLAAGGLEPYVPRAEKPWNAQRAAHLFRRAGFGCNWGDIQNALALSPAAIVDGLLSSGPLPSAPGSWVSQDYFQNSNAASAQYATWLRELQEWWFGLMADPKNMLREKMVLFWHNHFVSEYQVVYYTQYLYIQNQLFREFAFGDFKELTKRVTIDPAMLIYLDGYVSKAGNPNENYARELLELFAIGTGFYADGTPHYTEHDIIELARALTGWTPDRLSVRFNPASFDSSMKTIFGKSAGYGIQGKAEADVIDLIFEQVDKDVQQPRSAVFLCSKLYQTFVHHEPNMEIVAAMAQTLVENNWSVKAVLKALLSSEHFFDENVMGALIKSPADFMLASVRGFNLQPTMASSNRAVDRPETHDPITVMWYLSQWLFYPPNVKGWPGGRTWISSVTAPLRVRYAKMWVEPIPNSLPYQFDPVAFITSLPDADDVHKVLDNLITLLLPVPLDEETKKVLLAELLGGGFDYEWKPAQSAQKIRSCLVRLTSLAEFQLM
ncbi:MAG: DUF1800 domain-containing protein [Chlorobi bacterium CHB2]|nr:DUF1800 domain-containing protein [Chlorobi bacterium CHB2]